MYVLHYAPDNASLIVRLVLTELNQPFETALVDRRVRAQDGAAYRALNPNGLIPVLQTPAGVLFETAAILLWLADRHPGLGPGPQDEDRGDYLKWLFWTSNTLHADLRMTFYPANYAGEDAGVQAALLAVKLPHLDAWAAGRRDNARRYDALFAEAGLPPERLRTPVRRSEGHVYNQYVLRTDRRDALAAHLGDAGIGHAIYYPLCLHRQGCFANLGYADGSLPVAERASEEVLAIPVYPELDESSQRRVVDTIVSFLRA